MGKRVCYNNIESGNDAKYLKEKIRVGRRNGMFIGKRVEIRESTEIASVYQELSRKDRLAADCLFQQRLYNEAAYFYIQSM